MPTQNTTKTLTCAACGLTDSWTLVKSTYGSCGHTDRLCSCGAVEGVWRLKENTDQPTTAHRLEMALAEVARLTKRLKRYTDAEDTRAAALAASLPEAVEQAQHADAADFYGAIGRDEWPTR